MYGYGGNKKPRRPMDMMDRYDSGPELNQQPAPAPIPPPDLGQLNSQTMLNRPQMERLPETLTTPDAPVNVPNMPARPVSRDPIQRAREEAIYGGRMQADLDIKPKRGFWDIMKTAGVGALQGMATGGLGGAIGGALAGGIGSAISPEAGRGYRFDVMQRPRMEADIARQMAYDKFGREQRLGEIDLRKRQAEAEQTEAETRYLPARYGQEGALRQSQIEKNKASAASLSRPERPRYSPEEERRRQERHEKELLRIDAQTKRALRPPSSGGGGGGRSAGDGKTETVSSMLYNRYLTAQRQLADVVIDYGDDPGMIGGYLDNVNRHALELQRQFPNLYDVVENRDTGVYDVVPKGAKMPQRPTPKTVAAPAEPAPSKSLPRKIADYMFGGGWQNVTPENWRQNTPPSSRR